MTLKDLLERVESRDCAFHSVGQSFRPWESWRQILAHLQTAHYLFLHASDHHLQNRE